MANENDDDILLAIVDTEGQVGNMHQISICNVSLRHLMEYAAHGRARYSSFDQKCTPFNFGSFAPAVASKLNEAHVIVAHNVATDRNNIEAAFRDSGFENLLPDPKKWVCSSKWAQKVNAHPDSKIIKNSVNCSLKTLNDMVLNAPYRNRNKHSALDDVNVLVQILERVFLDDVDMFTMLLPRRLAKKAFVIRGQPQSEALSPIPSEDDAEPSHVEDAEQELPTQPNATDEPWEQVEVDDAERKPLSSLDGRVGTKVNGPLHFTCTKTARPVKKFYVWAWDPEHQPENKLDSFEPKANSRYSVREGNYIEVISGDRRVSYVSFRKTNCAGVYNVKERVLRLFHSV